MPKRSTISTMPEEYRGELVNLIQSPDFSYEKITELMNDQLAEDGADFRLSKSQVHRFGQEYRETAERMAQTREMASQLALDLGERESDDTFDMLVDMLSVIMFQAVKSQTIEDVKKVFNSGDFMKMAIAIKTLMEAKLKNINYRREIRIEAMKEAAAKVEKIATDRGLSVDIVNVFRQGLGIGEEG